MKISLTMAQIYDLAGANDAATGCLHQLHGRPKSKEDPKDLIPYDFGPGVRLTIALLLMKLTPYVQAYDQARLQVIKSAQMKALAANEGKPFEEVWVPSCPEWRDADQQLMDMLKESKEIEIDKKIPASALNADKNGLNPYLLIGLEPVTDFTA